MKTFRLVGMAANFYELYRIFCNFIQNIRACRYLLAVMLGAPFWFDLLNKVTNLRGTGAKPLSSSGANDNTLSTPAPAPAPITVTVNSNKDEEAAG